MNILFPTDFSENSRTALKYASNLATQLNGTITIVNAYEVPAMESLRISTQGTFDTGPTGRVQKKVADDKRAEVEEKLAEMREASGLSKEQCKVVAKTGVIKTEFDKILRNEKYHLIVMGTRGEGTQKGLFFSGIANHLIKTAGCPVLAVPENTAFKTIERILYPTDLAHDETYNLKWLVGYAKLNNAGIHLLHVKTNKESNRQEELNQLIDALQYDKITHEIITSKDDVSSIILDHCESDDADLIAMTTHSTSLFDKIFHFSVSTDILKKVNIPFMGFADKKTAYYNFE
jgi:nucleotide-binding universal stress UspA family protein